MKDLKWYIIIGLMALGMLLIWMNNCGGGEKKMGVLEGERNTLKKKLEAQEKASGIKRGEYKTTIATLEKDKVAIELKMNEDLGKKDVELTEKNRKLEEIREQPISIKRLQEEVGNLEGQVKNWQDKFTLLETELGRPIEYYDEQGIKRIKYPEGSVTFKLNEKHETQIKISLEWKGLYESEHELRLKGEESIRECEKQLAIAKVTGKIKTAIAIGEAIVFGYLLLK